MRRLSPVGYPSRTTSGLRSIHGGRRFAKIPASRKFRTLIGGDRAPPCFSAVTLATDPPTSTGGLAGQPLLGEEYLILSTVHSAKGCEWDTVFVIHAADGVIPFDTASDETEIEEERRLLYVALTRARNRLLITFPMRYYHRKHALGNAHSFAQLTRFVPPALFRLFERTGFSLEEAGADADGAVAELASVRVRERLRKLWR